MQEQENLNGNSSLNGGMKSTYDNGKDTQETLPAKRGSKMSAATNASPIVVSEQQFERVITEHSQSLNLINSSSDALLKALHGLNPPDGSGRVVGEYTAKSMRQITKSICQLVNAKSQVIRTMYQVARDEF